MQTARSCFAVWCLIWLGSSACSANRQAQPSEPPDPAPSLALLEVAEVQTVTTVQDSAGLFLSPTPERDVPSYVEQGSAAPAAVEEERERAKVEIALLFRSSEGAIVDSRSIEVQLASPHAAVWSPMQHYFPRVSEVASGVSWPIAVSSADPADLDDSISAEWRGWQGFRGLGVQSGVIKGGPRAPAATLDFEASGPESPLLLTAEGTDLVVVNRSDRVISQALLVYSHPGGVAVTVVQALGPGERAVTILGPKENPAGVLLELARDRLSTFFATAVGLELGAAMAQAKSIPFLETQGLRLIALLDNSVEPASVSFSAPVSRQGRVLVSHSEILKPEEEARVLSVIADPSLGAAQAPSVLGRFTEAKLEFAALNGDAAVHERSSAILTELRRR